MKGSATPAGRIIRIEARPVGALYPPTIEPSHHVRFYPPSAAMSLARLWRDQGKVSEARELLAPV
jgi:hypothetical protein